MKKYLGIVKITNESMIGINIEIHTRFSNSKSYIEKWFKLFPNSKTIILDNTRELQDFFEDFEDYSPVTKKEKEKAQKIYDEFYKKWNNK